MLIITGWFLAVLFLLAGVAKFTVYESMTRTDVINILMNFGTATWIILTNLRLMGVY